MINSAATKDWKIKMQGFEGLLETVNIASITTDAYCRQYVQHLIQHKKYYLKMYVGLFDQLLLHTDLPLEKICLMDYGSGNGLMGIFAKYCGFKNVILIDVDEIFMQSATSLAQQLNVLPDQFIVGDIETYFEKNDGMVVDAVIGTDVIEHVYNLHHFFGTISNINPKMVTVFSTASNPANKWKVQQLRKLQQHDEHVGGISQGCTHLEQAPHKAFVELRKNIIQEMQLGLDKHTLDKLIAATRGLNKVDIIAFVQHYQATGNFISTPSDPYNTCNPLNSSWTERILSIQTYQSIYLTHQFELFVTAGYYNVNKKGFKKYATFFLNLLVNYFGIKFAPYIILTAKKCA